MQVYISSIRLSLRTLDSIIMESIRLTLLIPTSFAMEALKSFHTIMIKILVVKCFIIIAPLGKRLKVLSPKTVLQNLLCVVRTEFENPA